MRFSGPLFTLVGIATLAIPSEGLPKRRCSEFSAKIHKLVPVSTRALHFSSPVEALKGIYALVDNKGLSGLDKARSYFPKFLKMNPRAKQILEYAETGDFILIDLW